MSYTINNPVLKDRIFMLCKTLQERDSQGWVYRAKPGGKYVRIERCRAGDERRSAKVHAFVRLADGMLMKPASWGAPQVRGERFALLDIKGYGHALRGCDPEGRYLYRRAKLAGSERSEE
jgi:hypothetical protein